MDSFFKIMSESVLTTALLSWFIAQFIKFITTLLKYRKFDFRRLTGSGGMPSSHSSMVCSLTTAVGFVDGFSSTNFAICTVLSLIVMYDASGVRRAAGQQARILNKLVEEWGQNNFENTEKKLKELLGHTPIEVFFGGLLGIAVAFFRHF